MNLINQIVLSTLLLGVVGKSKSSSSLPLCDTLQEFPSYAVPSTVFIAILVRNKAHILPYFLTLLEKIDYPKERIAIWIRSDQNEDNTPQILRIWAKHNWGRYHSLSVEVVDGPPYRQMDQDHSFHWSSKRHQHIIKLKQEALKSAIDIWADFIWFLDVDSLILNDQTLKLLVSKNKDLVAPLLKSTGFNSNFWIDMRDYRFSVSDKYLDTFYGTKKGCFEVPMIHSAVLMNIRKKNTPDFSALNATVPANDIIRFAVNAHAKNIPMEICNDAMYGFLMSPERNNAHLDSDTDRLRNLNVEIAGYWPEDSPVSELLYQFVPRERYPPQSTLVFRQVFIINLKRRPEKLTKMDHLMMLLGIDYTLIRAVDGKDLTLESMGKMGVKPLEEYRDAQANKTMTSGAIGCFLSHYKIWERMVKFNIKKALILEDDVRFEPNFVDSVQQVFNETETLKLPWNLIYLARKTPIEAMGNGGLFEPFVNNSKYLVHIGFSYTAAAYALTLKGAKKLIKSKPLGKIIPTDEYLSLMFDSVRDPVWKTAYPKRNLKAFSVKPVLVHEASSEATGFISDTINSPLVPEVQMDPTISTDLATPYNRI